MTKKILVVDDERLVVFFMKRTLEKIGYNVSTASSGEEALELIEKDGFDLIISDIAMSPVSGIELFHRIKDKGIPSRFIVMTGKYLRDDPIIKDLPMDGFLEKPFIIDKLYKEIEEVLSK
jgi:CheY-like chemotaxis protein